MLIALRRQFIARRLAEAGAVSAEEICRACGVSAMTAWRDLEALEAEGALRRVRGGAVRAEGAPGEGAEPTFARKEVRNADLKQAIGRVAASLVAPGESIILEGGTTVAAMVPFLTQPALTLLTNSAEILRFTAADHTVLCSGGVWRGISQTMTGPDAVAFFARHHASRCFLGASGYDPAAGLTDPNPHEILVKSAMADAAAERILLLDSSKFGLRAAVPSIDISRIQRIVTDPGIPTALLRRFRKQGIEVLIAGPDPG